MVNFSLAFFLLKTADWVSSNEFGILNWFPEIPLIYFVLLGILLLDFVGAYMPHFLEHKIKPLWMIHLVHHTDPNVDITTATRHHPLESLFRYFFTLLGVFLIGLPISVVMLYQSLSLFFTQFNHANIKFPNSFDLLLSYIIVTPGMHKTHHHHKLPFTDSNYGNIFSIWDRLFGTYNFLDQDNVIYGVDTFPDKEKNIQFNILLKQPFQQYRKPTTDKEGNLI
jgi:sterol desaturase/sphingolipid hydroxylase (fatty acid hydroxylase superfamily)